MTELPRNRVRYGSSDRSPPVRRGVSAIAMAVLVGLSVGGCAQGSTPAAPSVERVRHSVDSDGLALAVWEKSSRAPAAAILLIHGRTWSTVPDFDLQVPGEDLSLMDGLVGLGFATYGLDLRGYGETLRDETGWNTPARAAADVANALEWVRGRHPGVPVHLFGWSLGSMVSQLTAQQRPELIDRLVLFGYPNRPGAERSIEEPQGEPAMARTTAEAAASDFVTPGSISQAAIDAYVQAALAADPVRTDWTRGHEWNRLDPSAVTVPTLVLQGEYDPLAPAAAQERLFTELGTSDKAWVVVPGGDHAAFLEAPRPYFLATLESFLLRGGL